MVAEHLDVVVVGAGISGICAGYHLQKTCPNKRFAILEAREEMGGTWELFRYPGIRSDSDMFTLGFPFRPWDDSQIIADGGSILQYLRDTAAVFGLDQKMRFRHRVVRASWDTPTLLGRSKLISAVIISPDCWPIWSGMTTKRARLLFSMKRLNSVR